MTHSPQSRGRIDRLPTVRQRRATPPAPRPPRGPGHVPAPGRLRAFWAPRLLLLSLPGDLGTTLACGGSLRPSFPPPRVVAMPRATHAPERIDAWRPPRVGGNARLARLTPLIDWTPLAPLVAGLPAAPVGRPRYPPLLMVNGLLRQPWSQASAPAMAEAWGERLSVRRVVGVGLPDDAPDHSTINSPHASRSVTQHDIGRGMPPCCAVLAARRRCSDAPSDPTRTAPRTGRAAARRPVRPGGRRHGRRAARAPQPQPGGAGRLGACPASPRPRERIPAVRRADRSGNAVGQGWGKSWAIWRENGDPGTC